MLPLLVAGFLVAGVATTLLGPIVPWLLERGWHDDTVGLLFTAQFATSVVVGLLSGIASKRYGAAATIAAGYAIIGVGFVGYAPLSRPAHVAAAMTVGFGLGLVIPTSNLLAARFSERRAVGAVSILNVAWGTGAACWPLAVAAVVSRGASPLLLLRIVGALSVVAAIAVLSVRDRSAAPSTVRPAGMSATDGPETAAPGVAIAPTSRAAVARFAAIFGLYGAAEMTVGGWLTTYVSTLPATSPAAGETATAAFWGALTFGRLLIPWLIGRASEATLFAAAVFTALTGLALLLAAPGMLIVVIASVIVGAGVCLIFPLTVTALARVVSRDDPFAGAAVTASGVGGAIAPALVGWLAGVTGSLRVAPLVAMVSLVGVWVVHITGERSTPTDGS